MEVLQQLQMNAAPLLIHGILNLAASSVSGLVACSILHGYCYRSNRFNYNGYGNHYTTHCCDALYVCNQCCLWEK